MMEKSYRYLKQGKGAAGKCSALSDCREYKNQKSTSVP